MSLPFPFFGFPMLPFTFRRAGLPPRTALLLRKVRCTLLGCLARSRESADPPSNDRDDGDYACHAHLVQHHLCGLRHGDYRSCCAPRAVTDHCTGRFRDPTMVHSISAMLLRSLRTRTYGFGATFT
ncbi:unannotated protein [freshwater metagenome]|uniref:Unannotated protein n=1 Tax=freshwater metagenome TaxID=449393 RepID=A0A6J7J646_9ZZZZ